MENANAEFSQYTGTQEYYRYHCGTLLTEGVKALADQFKCYWLLDIIASFQTLLLEDFQVWTLEKHDDNTATVKASDGNEKQLISQAIPYTDFEAVKATVWVEGNVLLLPSEH
jgi:hypothetical protein